MKHDYSSFFHIFPFGQFLRTLTSYKLNFKGEIIIFYIGLSLLMTENQSKINPFLTGVAPSQTGLSAASLFQNKPLQTTIFSTKKDVENNPDQETTIEKIEPKQ
jgi:hypothetical protein